MRLILLSIFAWGLYSIMRRIIEENAAEPVLALPPPDRAGVRDRLRSRSRAG